MGKIRVLRLIEYLYDTPEKAASDRLRWTESLNGGGIQMRSAELPMEVLDQSTDVDDDADIMDLIDPLGQEH